MKRTSAAVGGILCAALGAAALWGGLELTEPEEPCALLRVGRDIGESSRILACPRGSYGTVFIEVLATGPADELKEMAHE